MDFTLSKNRRWLVVKRRDDGERGEFWELARKTTRLRGSRSSSSSAATEMGLMGMTLSRSTGGGSGVNAVLRGRGDGEKFSP